MTIAEKHRYITNLTGGLGWIPNQLEWLKDNKYISNKQAIKLLRILNINTFVLNSESILVINLLYKIIKSHENSSKL